MAKILVIDDEPDILRVIVKILESRGHEVWTASDGPEALERVGREMPDAIVLDLQLPRMDGFEVCRRLKEDPATRHIPVVMMSAAYVTLDDARRGQTAGADEYVVKPFLREVLIHNVERLLP
jgi:two-component system, OmpR family, alkaline phosphatase synthesis response regulator PhoP